MQPMTKTGVITGIGAIERDRHISATRQDASSASGCGYCGSLPGNSVKNKTTFRPSAITNSSSFVMVIAVVLDPVPYLLNLRDYRDPLIGQLHSNILKTSKDFADADSRRIVGDPGIDIFVDEDRVDLKQMLFEKQFDGVEDREDRVLAARIRAYHLRELEADA